ncbi:MAG TPA: hypothetical protein VGC64_12205, partial [Pyrinomonadaceae bacterium]
MTFSEDESSQPVLQVVQEPAASGRVRRWSKAFVRLLLWIRRELGAPLAFILCALLLQILAAIFPALVERLYARPLYPAIVNTLSFFSRHFGFSVGELLTCLLIIMTLVCGTRLGLQLYFDTTGRLKRVTSSTRFAL